MINKTKTVIIFILILGIFLVNFVNAEMLTSNAGVQYDSRILEEFEKIKMNETINETFIGIVIELKDFSKSNDLLSIFSENETKDIAIRNLSERVGVDLTEEAFFKLIQDDRVSKVYYDIKYYPTEKNTLKLIEFVFIIILVIIILLIYVSSKKRKNK